MKKSIIALSFVSLFLGACSSDILQPEEERVPILPTTNIDGIEVLTRGEGVIGKDSAINISIFRADEVTTGTYAANWTGKSALAAAVATDGKVTFTSAAEFYLSNGNKTKLIGVYPAVGSGGTWSDSDGKVTYTIDGATDIMVSSFSVESDKETGKTTSPALAFEHLLTQIQVYVIAEDAAAISLWGDVTAVSVTDRENSCVVQLPMPSVSTNPAPTFPTESKDDLVVCKTDGTAVAPVVPTTSEREFGVCMFAPITASATLPLSVTTSTGGTVSVTVPTGTYVAGTAYKIVLKLTAKGIHPTATLANWTSAGSTTVEM